MTCSDSTEANANTKLARSPQDRMKTIDYRYGTTLSPLLKRHFLDMLDGVTLRKSANALLFLLEMKMKVLTPRARPLYVKIEPTNHCNQQCAACATQSSRPKGFMDIALYKRIIDLVKPYCLRNCLYGQGESFVHKNILEMIEYSEQRNCPVVICTNFSSVTPSQLPRLLDSGLNRIIVCVDGLTQEKHTRFRVGGNLSRVLGNLHELARLKVAGGYKHPAIEVQTIAFDYNTADMPAISRLVCETGAEVHVIRQDMFNLLKVKAKKTTCPYLWGSVFFTWDGKMCPCEGAHIDSRHMVMDFEEIERGVDYWSHPKMTYARSLARYGKQANRHTGIHCEDCPFYPL